MTAITITGENVILEAAEFDALHARVRELEAALREGAEFLHAFTPAGTAAVDAFIAKWSDRSAPETKGNESGTPQGEAGDRAGPLVSPSSVASDAGEHGGN
jgi:hypothetical protein